MKRTESPIRPVLALIALGGLIMVFCQWSPPALALDPSLDITQYAHTAWTFHNGFLNGTVYAIAQTPDGYLWLGTQSGVVRFDGVRAVPLAPPPGQQLPSSAVMTLLAARDGTLWIGTLDGLASWKNGRLTEYAELARYFVNALLEDRDGTVWAGGVGSPTGKLCAIRSESTTCYGDDGRLGAGVASLYEDTGGSLWVGATTGLWRWKPHPPICYISKPPVTPQGLTQGDGGSGLIVAGDSVRQIVGGKVIDYPLRGAPSSLTAQKLLRDRNGGLWVGTWGHGLVHSHQGKTSLFTQHDGLTSDRVLAIFEDREGTIWVATPEGLDQFRESPVTPLSVPEGLSSSIATSVLAARDGSIWIGTADGLNRWRSGRITIYRKRSDPGLPGDEIQSLFQDEGGGIWVSGLQGLAVFEKERFTAVPSVPPGSVHAIAGDNHGGLWLSLWVVSGDYGLVHLVNGKIVEQMPWQKVGGGPGSGLVPDPEGGVWTGLIDGGMAYFHDGEIRQLSSSKDGLGAGRVFNVGRSRDGALWAATENGLSRITPGRVSTLTTANGLPCNSVHWVIEDDVSSYWLYTRCGLVRIARTELEAWAADPKRTIHATTFDSADGIRLGAKLKGARPQVTKSSDGKIWFVNGDTVSFVDPSHIGINTLPPPVHIEQITADGKVYTPAAGNRRLRLPPLVRNLAIDFVALSLVAPQKNHCRFKLEGWDRDWREAVNEFRVEYSNLPPRNYRFRIIACNNSGVWNEQGDVLDFFIALAYYQTNWFRALLVAVSLTLLYGLYQLRIQRLHRQEKQLRLTIDTIPGYVWSALPDGSIDFINRRWLEFSGFSLEDGLGRGWEAAVHPDDLARFMDDWRAALSCGKAMESEARIRRADGQYRWLLIRNVPFHDEKGKIVKWYGTSTDIHDRKRAEEALGRLNRELRALSNCNQTLLRATDEQSLLQEICRIVCEEAGYRMAWVGYAEHDEAQSVRPVAWTAGQEGYVATAGITWADTERGRGPTGTAIRSGKTCCIQDFATDPRLAPWRESAVQRDFRSSIALPLKDEQANAFGSLNIYSAQPNAFTSEEIRLLEELAADLAFGVVTLRSRAARKQAEQEVALLSLAVDKVHEAAFLIDDRGRFQYVNEEGCRALGYTRAELLGLSVPDIDPGFPAQRWSDHWRDLKAQGSLSFESRHRTRDGRTFPVEVSANYFEYGGRAYNLALVRDITQRKRAEEERERLRQLEADLAHINRVSMLGELATSIAHEVKQPLAGVVSNASAGLRWLAGEAPNLEEAREGLRRIVRDGKRAGEVIDRIRALTRGAEMPREKLDLNETLREVLALVGDEAKRRSVIIRTRFAEDLSAISGDRVQLQQVVLNLVMNGIEAMSSVGERARELVITTRTIDPDQVEATVEDSGIGLDPNTIDRIFDSFYTTKPGGMGMGLSISRSIVQAHGGRLWATARDGAGTMFHFTLPNYHEEGSHAGVAGV